VGVGILIKVEDIAVTNLFGIIRPSDVNRKRRSGNLNLSPSPAKIYSVGSNRYLRTEKGFSLRNVVSGKIWKMDNVQQHSYCSITSHSPTFIFSFHKWHVRLARVQQKSSLYWTVNSFSPHNAFNNAICGAVLAWAEVLTWYVLNFDTC
jgi:hypothetical protein